jgi:hypothetical protein
LYRPASDVAPNIYAGVYFDAFEELAFRRIARMRSYLRLETERQAVDLVLIQALL